MSGLILNNAGALAGHSGPDVAEPEVVYYGEATGDHVFPSISLVGVLMLRISLFCTGGDFGWILGDNFGCDGIQYDDGNHLGSFTFNGNGIAFQRLTGGAANYIFEATARSDASYAWAGRVYGSTQGSFQFDSRVYWQGWNGKVQFKHYGGGWAYCCVEKLL